MANLNQIRDGEEVRSALFGSFDESVGGGHYWTLELVSSRTIGTRSEADQVRRNQRLDLVKAENMKVIVKAFQDAIEYEAQVQGPGEI